METNKVGSVRLFLPLILIYCWYSSLLSWMVKHMKKFSNYTGKNLPQLISYSIWLKYKYTIRRDLKAQYIHNKAYNFMMMMSFTWEIVKLCIMITKGKNLILPRSLISTSEKKNWAKEDSVAFTKVDIKKQVNLWR